MDIFQLLGTIVKEEDPEEREQAIFISLEKPRPDVVEEKVKKLVERDIEEHGKSRVLNIKSSIKLYVNHSVIENHTSEATPLIWAACQGRTTLVEFFLSRGANINATDNHDRTALIWAADIGDLETVKCLIKHGADLEKKDLRYKSTALNWAAYQTHPCVVEVLVEAGAVIDSPNNYGQTALGLGFPNLEIIEILLKAGAQLSETMFDQIQRKMGEDFALNFKVA